MVQLSRTYSYHSATQVSRPAVEFDMRSGSLTLVANVISRMGEDRFG